MGSYLVDAEQGAFLVLLRMTVQHPAHTLYEIYWGNVEEYALATGGKVEELARFGDHDKLLRKRLPNRGEVLRMRGGY